MEKVKGENRPQEIPASRTSEAGIKLSKVIAIALERERSRFSAELHDGLGQLLVAMKLYVESLLPNVGPESQFKIEQLFQLLTEAKKEIRNYAHNLSAKDLENKGLEQTLKKTAERINATGRVNITIESNQHFPRLSSETELGTLRMLQEQISNSLIHGGAKNIYIKLRSDKGKIEIEYGDDGEGFNMKTKCRKNGNGIDNLKERAKNMNGVLKITSNPGFGYESLLQFKNFRMIPSGEQKLKRKSA